MSAKKSAEIITADSAKLMPEDALGERIRQVREQLGLTHDGLSSLTKMSDSEGRGISRTTIRGYELGTYKPGAREIRILSSALRKSPTWLLLGQEGNENSSGPVRPTSSESSRWADIVFPVLAIFQLGKEEKKQIAAMVETLLRLKIGEVRFRSMKSFIEDFGDTLQDALRDRNQYKNDPDEIKSVFLATVEDMRKRHGDAEANLLVSTMEPIFQFWESSTK